MSTQPFDPQRYKDRQRQEWNAVAEGWRKWWPLIEQGAPPVVALVAGQPAERHAELRYAVVEAARAFVQPGGGFSMPNEAVLVVGTASGGGA